MEPFIAIITVAVIITIYLGTYMLNKKVPAPYEKIDTETCSACTNYACGVKQQFSEER